VLLFSCNGRGRGFFGRPDHDAGLLARATGDVPLAGFFAQGELGPVGTRNFVHGYTASMALFCDPSGPPRGTAAMAEEVPARLPETPPLDLPDGPPTPTGAPEPV
jgi:hypothetical protein